MNRPVIVITGAAAWFDSIAPALAGYTPQRLAQRAGYIPWLADHQTALIIVDGADPDWRFWATTPKTSPATRRIPVIVAADDAQARRAALLAGADVAVSAADLRAQIARLVADYARVPDPALLHELECQCDQPLPPLAVQGVAKFNAGEYYPQHDLFEEQWVNTSGPVRDLYRAILQVGVAYYQIERGNYRGALKMLLRSVQWLALLPDVCQGVDVKQLREDSYRVRAELEAMRPQDIGQFDRRLLRPVRLVTDPPRAD
jgi:predicted metal-dependent hydrolase